MKAEPILSYLASKWNLCHGNLFSKNAYLELGVFSVTLLVESFLQKVRVTSRIELSEFPWGQ